MRLLPNLQSPSAAQLGTLRLGHRQYPLVAYLLNRGQTLCTLICVLSYLAGQGVGWQFWAHHLGKYVAATLLNGLGFYITDFASAGILLGLLSATLFARGTLLKCACMTLSLVLCLLYPSFGIA